MAGPVAEEAAVAIPVLTEREEQCLWMIACGMTNKEMANRLGLSPRTIEIYALTLNRKFGVSNRLALAMFVLTTGWRPSPKAAGKLGIEACAGCRETQIVRAVDCFRTRLRMITCDPHWRHPNLRAVADRLRSIEKELLLWSRNQQLIDEAPRQTVQEASKEPSHPSTEATGKPT
ncbi:MAG TPA: LuxR C-terminal-related transcriptional regulator [Alphaproteobacteria bacterium]|nr:LuxR C-terminal-related transcriptional regulator [Alphaproteobacteria bacterium]